MTPPASGTAAAATLVTPTASLTPFDLRALACAALLVHALVFIGSIREPARSMEEDSRGYLSLASNLVEDGRFGRLVRTGGGPEESWRPELARTPGYPAVIATFDRLTAHRRIATVAFQHLLTIALTVVVAALSARRWGRRAGLLAGLLLVLDLQGVALSNMLLTETLYGVLLFACVVGCVRVLERPSMGVALLVGGGAGLSALVRPTSIALPLALGALVVACQVRRSRARALVVGILVVVSGMSIVEAWTVRNGVVCGEYTLSTVARYNLLACHAAGALARAEHIDDQDATTRLCATLGISEQQLRYAPLTNAANAAIRDLAVNTIRTHPAGFVKDYTLRTLNMLAGPEKHALTALGLPPVRIGEKGGGFAAVLSWIALAFQVAFLCLVYALVLRSAVRSWSDRRLDPMLLTLVLCAAYVLVLSSGSPGDPRMRWPAMPLLVMMAASSLRAGTAFATRQAAARSV